MHCSHRGITHENDGKYCTCLSVESCCDLEVREKSYPLCQEEILENSQYKTESFNRTIATATYFYPGLFEEQLKAEGESKNTHSDKNIENSNRIETLKRRNALASDLARMMNELDETSKEAIAATHGFGALTNPHQNLIEHIAAVLNVRYDDIFINKSLRGKDSITVREKFGKEWKSYKATVEEVRTVELTRQSFSKLLTDRKTYNRREELALKTETKKLRDKKKKGTNSGPPR